MTFAGSPSAKERCPQCQGTLLRLNWHHCSAIYLNRVHTFYYRASRFSHDYNVIVTWVYYNLHKKIYIYACLQCLKLQYIFDMQTSGLFWKCGNIGTKLQYSIKITLDLSSDKNYFPERDAELRAVQAPNRERERVLLTEHIVLYKTRSRVRSHWLGLTSSRWVKQTKIQVSLHAKRFIKFITCVHK